jgi:hypothetical protein
LDLHKNAWGYERQPDASVPDLPAAAEQAPAIDVSTAPAAKPVKSGKATDKTKAGLASLLAKLKAGEAELTSEVEDELNKLIS